MPTQILVLNKSQLVTGDGDPEGATPAPVGSLYLREDGAAGSSLYVKEDGGTGTTGWTRFGGQVAVALHAATHTPGQSDVIPNVAWTNQSNTFSATRPELALQYGADLAKARFVAAVPGGNFNLSVNLHYDGTNWMRDDPAVGGAIYGMGTDGATGLYRFTAGGNPATLTAVITTDPVGNVSMPASLTVGGSLTAASLNVPHALTHRANGPDAIPLVAWTNQANTFTQNQLLRVVKPELQLQYQGYAAKGRVQAQGPNVVAFTMNMGTDVNGATILDDVALGGCWHQQVVDANAGAYAWYSAVPGANPVPLITLMSLGTTALDLFVPTRVAGYVTASYITTSAVGNNLADLTVGNVAINGNVTMAGYTHIIGASGYTAGLQIYPGSVIDGSAQLDYCLAAHPSYGLWCNTGLYLQSMLTIYSGGAQITGTLVVNNLSVNAGNCVVAGNVHCSAGYVYPGDIGAGGTMQSSWFIAGHSAYGMYINTGLYVAGAIWSAGLISPGQGFQCRAGYPGPLGPNGFNFNWTGVIQAWVDNSYCGDIAYASDARVKRDFTPLTGSLAKVQQFKPGTFYYRQLDPDVPSDGHLRLGLVAQDVQAVAPELVHDMQMVTALTPDGEMLRVSYVEMIPMLIAAIQELSAKVDAKEH